MTTPLLTTPLLTLAVRTEIRKVRTLRHWWIGVAAPAAVAALAGIWFGVATRATAQSDDTKVPLGGGSIGLYITIGAAVVCAGLFGAISTGSDVHHRTLAATFVLLPNRDAVIAAKLAVGTAVAVLGALLAEAVSVVVLLGFGVPVTSGSRLLGVLACGLLATACWALIGAGLGLLVRSAYGAALAVVGWFAIGEPALALLASAADARGAAYWLPGLSTVSAVAAGGLADVAGFLPSAAAAALLVLWAVAVAGSAWWLVRQRDIL